MSGNACIPNIFHRNLKFLEIRNHILQISPAGISPATLMVTQCIVLLHGRQSNGADLVVLGDLNLARTGVEGQVDTSAQCSPSQVLWLRNCFQTVGISQEHAVREGIIFLLGVGFGSLDWSEGAVLALLEISGVQIKGVTAVEVPEDGQLPATGREGEVRRHTSQSGYHYQTHTQSEWHYAKSGVVGNAPQDRRYCSPLAEKSQIR